MKIALAQMDVKAGDPDTNFKTITRFVEDAHKQGADIVAFPEMCVGGYLVGDLWLDDDWCRWLMTFNEKIRKLSETNHIGIIYGNIYLADDIVPTEIDRQKGTRFCNHDGRAIRFNAAYAFQNGIPVNRTHHSKYLPPFIQPKTLLPNYRYFDDERYFMSSWEFYSTYGDNFFTVTSPFSFSFGGDKYLVGVILCEDMWCKDYNINPSFALSAQGSKIIINLSQSPWTFGKNEARDRRVSELLNWREKIYVKKHTDSHGVVEGYSYRSEFEIGQLQDRIRDGSCSLKFDKKDWDAVPSHPPLAYVNSVGSQNNGKNILVFDGASTVYGQDGKPKILANAIYEEELLVFDPDQIGKKTATRKKYQKIARKYEAIIRGIKHMSEITGIKKYVIGLSGGVDSAVVACLLVKAVGKENVIAINMPTKYNSKKTRDVAASIARKLGIDYRIVPIESLVSANMGAVLIGAQVDRISSLTEENIQAKIRGTSLLSNIAGQLGAFFTCNGNKDEIAFGYATLYGDWGGAIAPIGDLTKAEVYHMAEYLNQHVFRRSPIPKKLLPTRLYKFNKGKIQPSAELKDDQVDPIKVGYHCALIEQFLDYNIKSPTDIIRWWKEGSLAKKLSISPKLLGLYGLNDPHVFLKDLKWVCERIRGAVFKRVQSVPLIVLSKTAWGFDRRESILPSFQWTASAERELKVLLTR